MNSVWTIARKELSDSLRNRWLLAIAIVFAVLAVGIAWCGCIWSGWLRLYPGNHRQLGQPGHLPDSADCLAAGLRCNRW